MSKLGIVWQGSKRRLVEPICDIIDMLAPTSKPTDTCIIDAFCGGFAISAELLKRGYRVTANDLNTSQIKLLEAIFGFDKQAERELNAYIERPEWVSRERFFDALAQRDAEHHTWFTGMCQSVWSFGGNQQTYLYGKELETYKRVAHALVVDRDTVEFCKTIGTNYEAFARRIAGLSTMRERRLLLKKIGEQNPAFQHLQQLQHLERLERLQHLNGLKRQSRLTFASSDYQTILQSVSLNTIVYCDPPYEGTFKYATGAFDHKTFWENVSQIAETNPILVSEYAAPEGFVSVAEWHIKTLMPSKGQTDTKPEKLFTTPRWASVIREKQAAEKLF